MTRSRPVGQTRRFAAATSAVLAAATLATGCSTSTTRPGAASSGGSAVARTSAGISSSTSTISATHATHADGSFVGSSFCRAATAEQARQAVAARALSSTSSPAVLRALEERAMAQLPRFLAIAPAAIKPDLQIVVAAEQSMLTALKAANYDVRTLTSATTAALDSPKFAKAVRAITSYLSTACGITSPSPVK